MERKFFVLAVVAVIAGPLAACGPQGQPPRMTPHAGYIVLHEQPIQLTAELPGRTDSYAVSNVEPQVTGIIQARLFTEGGNVKAGQPLYQIDPRPYKAVLDQARGQ